ncbi:MAG: type VI secretion system amidase immunity protein Tai4 [Pelistega sp.]|nr:type VI secretion system amidase immunity protein Tai4 [Pelistega sp.]
MHFKRYLPNLKAGIASLTLILSSLSIAGAEQSENSKTKESTRQIAVAASSANNSLTDKHSNNSTAENPSNNAAARQWPPATASRSYAQNYKDLALIQCIGTAYKDHPEVAKDIGASASVVFAWSDYDLEESTGKVPELVEQYLARHYELKPDRISERASMPRADLMKCLDMYHGPELETFIKLYVPHPERSFEDDNPELYNQ